MARSSQNDESDSNPDDDTVGAATRALAEATAALTKLLGKQMSNVGTEVSDIIAVSLRQTARGLADASASVDRRSDGHHADQGRRARVARTRAGLLAAAARVFAAQGYEGASVGDIAADAGYTKGALYAHFDSKSDLFLVLAREVLCHETETPDVPGRLAEELTTGLTGVADDPSMLLALEILAYAVRHPESRPELGSLFTRSLELLAQRVRDDRLARSDGQAAPEDPARGVTQDDRDSALGLLAVANVTAMLATVTETSVDTQGAGARLITRLLRP